MGEEEGEEGVTGGVDANRQTQTSGLDSQIVCLVTRYIKFDKRLTTWSNFVPQLVPRLFSLRILCTDRPSNSPGNTPSNASFITVPSVLFCCHQR
jgi:hypothetical protein